MLNPKIGQDLATQIRMLAGRIKRGNDQQHEGGRLLQEAIDAGAFSGERFTALRAGLRDRTAPRGFGPIYGAAWWLIAHLALLPALKWDWSLQDLRSGDGFELVARAIESQIAPARKGAKRPTRKRPAWKRLILKDRIAIFEGTDYPITESGHRFLAALQEKQGGIVAGTDVKGRRAFRIYKELPPALQEIIVKLAGHGTRGYRML